MPDTMVGVPYVQQEKVFYCGPATLQMIFSSFGVGGPPLPPSWQDQLWVDVQNNTGAVRPSAATTQPSFPAQKCEWCTKVGWRCWNTTPGALEALLNARQGVATYTTTVVATDADATGAVLDAIDANLPGIALVRGWLHWLIADGYRHDEPGATVVAGRNLNGIYLRDPWVPATHYVKWTAWKNQYLKPIPCGQYRDSMIVMRGVRNRVPVPPPPPQPIQISGPSIPNVTTATEMHMAPLVPVAMILDNAQTAATELMASSRMRIGFGGAKPKTATLVQRLDEVDSYYYIVSFSKGAGDTARLVMDASSGEMLEASAVEKGDDALPAYDPSTESLRRVLSDATRYADSLPFRIRPEAVGQHPVLVWMPCTQSATPFMPFYQYSVGDSFLYYRVDGERFEQLTLDPA